MTRAQVKITDFTTLLTMIIWSGHVSSTYVERLKGISLVVRSEVVTDPPHKTLSLSYIVYFLMIVGGLDVNLFEKKRTLHTSFQTSLMKRWRIRC